MADVGDAVYFLLANSAAVQALLGTGSAARIYPDMASQKVGSAVAFVVYKLVSDVRDYTHGGDSNLAHARVQVDCYAPGPARTTIKNLAAAVLSALQGYTGTPGGGVTIQSCFQQGRHSFVVPSVENDNLRSFGYSIDFEIWYAG